MNCNIIDGVIMTGIGIIGVGGWGKNHVRVFSTLKSEGLIDFIGIADISKEVLKKLTTIYNIDLVTTSYEDLLKNENIDGIVIATPTPLHFEHALKALECNKHVLVEKPLTETVEQGEKLIRVANKNELILMVGFLLRYSPAIRYARDLIASGEIGKVLSISAKRTSLWPNRKLDVGVVRDLAIHDIDLVRYLTDANPILIFAIGGKLIHEYEDYASIILEYKGGKSESIATLIEVSWVTPYKIRRMEVVGTKGSLEIELLKHSVSIFFENELRKPLLPYREPLMEEDKNFVLSITGREKPIVTGEDGLVALKACFAALKSMHEKKVIRVFE